VKGAFVIAGYTLILALHFTASWFGSTALQWWLMLPGIPLAALTAVYTAFLFAQAKARDLWQNPLLPPHLLVQSFILGALPLLPFAGLFRDFERASFLFRHPNAADRDLPRYAEIEPLLWIVAVGTLVHLLMVWGEVSLTHGSAHARIAAWEMTQGRYKHYFWIGVVLSLLGGLVAALGGSLIGLGSLPLALIGMMLYEHVYVQAGQSVPLA
jgi:Ni/Fe-hydrogenase subunit HybB-like protein